jgi:hypothetical protein
MCLILLVMLVVNPIGALVILPAILLAALFVLFTQACLMAAHLLAARRLGFRIEHAAVGPLMILCNDRFNFELIRAPGEFGSYRVIAPSSGTQTLRKYAYLASGMFVVVPVIMSYAAVRMLMLVLGDDEYVVPLAASAAVASVLMGLVYLLGTAADVFRRKVSWAGRLSMESAFQPLNEPSFSTMRPRDWPADEVKRQASVVTDEYASRASERLLQAYYHALDSGDIESAGLYIDQTTMYTAQGLRRFSTPSLAAEHAYFMARHRGNCVAARAWLVQIDRRRTPQHVVMRAQAALHLAEGNPHDAQRVAIAACEALLREPLSGLVKAELEWIQAVLDEAEVSGQFQDQNDDPTDHSVGRDYKSE